MTQLSSDHPAGNLVSCQNWSLGTILNFQESTEKHSCSAISCEFRRVVRSVKVSITVYYVYTILTCKLGLLCIANSHSMRVTMASSEDCLGLSPYKTYQKVFVPIYFDLIKEMSVKLIRN